MHHLRIFQAVATCENYSRAAERLHISQPAVSMQIARLEEALGVTLIEQRGRQIVLTEAGRMLSSYASRIFRIAEEADRAMEDFRDNRRGRLRLTASSTPGAYVLPALIASFRERYPDVLISLQISNTHRALDLFMEGAADLAVVGDVSTVPSEVMLEPLYADQLLIVVAPNHRWAQRREVSAQELAQEPLIVRESGSSTREVLDTRLAQSGLQVHVGLELGNAEAIKQAVASGIGAGVLSTWAVRWEIESGRLVPVRTIDLNLDRWMHLALPANHVPSGIVTRFIEHLRQERAKSP